MVNNKSEMQDRNGKSKILICISFIFFPPHQNPEKTTAYAHILNINQNELMYMKSKV